MGAGYRAVPAIISYVVIVVGGSIALTFAWGRKHLLWGIVLLLAGVVVTILEGSYRQARHLEQDHAKALAAQGVEHVAALTAARTAREADHAAAQAKALRYFLGLDLEGKPATQPRASDRQPETGYAFTLRIQNNSAQAMGWEMKSFIMTMDGGYTARPGQAWGSATGFTAPGSFTPFYYHWLPAPTDPLLGCLGDVELEYWHPANGLDGPRFRTRQRFSIGWTAYPGRVPEAHMVIQGLPAHEPVQMTTEVRRTTGANVSELALDGAAVAVQPVFCRTSGVHLPMDRLWQRFAAGARSDSGRVHVVRDERDVTGAARPDAVAATAGDPGRDSVPAMAVRGRADRQRVRRLYGGDQPRSV